MAILTRQDLDVHFGDDFFPTTYDNGLEETIINEPKITEDLILTEKEIEKYLRRAGITVPVVDADVLLDLKPIALDLIAYRLNNLPEGDTDLFLQRRKSALKDLDALIEGLQCLSETATDTGVKTIKLFR